MIQNVCGRHQILPQRGPRVPGLQPDQQQDSQHGLRRGDARLGRSGRCDPSAVCDIISYCQARVRSPKVQSPKVLSMKECSGKKVLKAKVAKNDQVDSETKNVG